MLTANADEESRQYYLSCGADDFLVKPIDEAMLHQSLTRAIEVRLAEGAMLLPLLQNSTSLLESLFGATEAIDTGTAAAHSITSVVDDDANKRPSLKQRMSDAFRVDLPRRLDELDVFFSRQDKEGLAHLFHGLKGSAGYIWPEGDLQELSALLEKAADQGDWHLISEKTPPLRAILQRIMEGAEA
jgi:CheY-like chemotaxis protein